MRGFSQAAEVSGSAGNEGEGGGGVCWRRCLFPNNGDCAGFQIGPSARGLRCPSYIAGFSTPDGVNFLSLSKSVGRAWGECGGSAICRGCLIQTGLMGRSVLIRCY